MSKLTKLIAVFTLSAFTFVACTTTNPNQNSNSHGDSMSSNTPDPVEEIAAEVTEEVVAEVPAEETTAVPDPLPDPQYRAYSESEVADLDGEPFALFFHASWCPTCHAIQADLEENLSSFPQGSTIAEVNFDTATALRQKYGVNVQSTILIIDADGNKVETLAAPSATEIKNALAQVL